MEYAAPEGWKRDSDTAYIHASGVCIRLMTYRSREGWVLLPVDLDQAGVRFEPTSEGRDQAFEAFARGVLDPKQEGASELTPRIREAREAARRDAAPEEPEEDDDEDEGV